MTLGDGDINMSDDDIVHIMVENDDILPTIPVRVHDQLIRVHKQHYVYDSFFDYLMLTAAEKLKAMVDAPKRFPNILVHCAAGRNRSAAVIAAYLMLIKKQPYAIEMIQETVKKKRGVDSLTNRSFILALQFLYLSSMEPIHVRREAAQKKHIQRYTRIIRMAFDTLKRERENAETSDKGVAIIMPEDQAIATHINVGGKCVGTFYSRNYEEIGSLHNKLCTMLEILPHIMDKSCSECGAVTTTLKRCSACKSVFYCSVTCQQRDAHRHIIEDGCKF